MSYEKLESAIQELVNSCDVGVEEITLTIRPFRRHPPDLEYNIQIDNQNCNRDAPGLSSGGLVRHAGKMMK